MNYFNKILLTVLCLMLSSSLMANQLFLIKQSTFSRIVFTDGRKIFDKPELLRSELEKNPKSLELYDKANRYALYSLRTVFGSSVIYIGSLLVLKNNMSFATLGIATLLYAGAMLGGTYYFSNKAQKYFIDSINIYNGQPTEIIESGHQVNMSNMRQDYIGYQNKELKNNFKINLFHINFSI